MRRMLWCAICDKRCDRERLGQDHELYQELVGECHGAEDSIRVDKSARETPDEILHDRVGRLVLFDPLKYDAANSKVGQ